MKHFRLNEELKIDLVELLTYLSVHNTTASLAPTRCSTIPIARIISVSYSDFPAPSILNSSIFHWELSNHWFQNSYFGADRDIFGFYLKRS